MKRMIIFGHPDMSKSNVSAAWAEVFSHQKDITIQYLDKAMTKLDVEQQRQLIRDHDRILFVFPLYWYRHPAIMQEWVEKVFTGGDPSSSRNDFYTELRTLNKEFMIATTAAASEEDFRIGGKAAFPIDVILSSWYATCNFCNIRMIAPAYVYYNVYQRSNQETVLAAKELLDIFSS